MIYTDRSMDGRMDGRMDDGQTDAQKSRTTIIGIFFKKKEKKTKN